MPAPRPGIRCFGPSKAAALLEGSKSFFKEIANAAGAPTAADGRFTDAASARAYIREKGAPIVVKADGLAAGKGVVVAETVEEAEQAVTEMMEDASRRRRLHPGHRGMPDRRGDQLLRPVRRHHAIPIGAAQDHKRVGDGDTGPNTGGMGAYSPPPAFTEAMQAEVMKTCITPVLAETGEARHALPGRALRRADADGDGPKLLEFNVRFGDPECQALMLRLRIDLLAALVAACDGRAGPISTCAGREEASILVVMAAEGYPGAPRKNTEIRGLEDAAQVPGVQVFHAGTARREDGELISTGGRVLGVAGIGGSLREAHDAAYAAVNAIRWPQGFCRRDIGWRAL
jgi:phosphoribosylamine--glycine ligase